MVLKGGLCQLNFERLKNEAETYGLSQFQAKHNQGKVLNYLAKKAGIIMFECNVMEKCLALYTN